MYEKVHELNVKLSKMIPDLKEEIKNLKIQVDLLQNQLNEYSVLFNDRKSTLLIGQISFELENEIKKVVLRGRKENLFYRFKISDFENPKSGFKLTPTEENRWKVLKERIKWNTKNVLSYRMRAMKQLKQIRVGIGHPRKMISKDDMYELIDTYFRGSKKEYYANDAKDLVETLCIITGKENLYE